MKKTFEQLKSEMMLLHTSINQSCVTAAAIQGYLDTIKNSPKRKSVKINKYLLNDIYNLADCYGNLAECVRDAVYSLKILDCFFEKDNSSDVKAASTHDKITDGLKHDGGKPRLDFVPPEIIEAVGTVMTHGAEKYGEASYRNVEPKRYRAALVRHICKWLKDPYGKDEDSGLPHLWHVACNVAFLLELDSKKE